MKSLRLPAAIFCFFILLSSPAWAEQMIRIGLYYNSSLRTNAVLHSASLSNPDGFTLSLLLTDPVLLPLTHTQANLAPLARRGMIQIAAGSSADEILAAAREVSSRGLKAYLVYREDGTNLPYKVWVEETLAAVKALGYPGAFAADTQGNLLVLNPSAREPGVIVDGRVGLGLAPVGQSPTRLVAAPGHPTRHYEGVFELTVTNGRLGIVNILNLENYLFGVVPFEMSDNWPIEALKAQAVAARSYALANLNKHRELGFDLCDSPACCQKYAGFVERFVNSRQAVAETAGRVARFNGQVAELFYHSNSGGFTENSEDVWLKAVPYARAVPDPLSIDDSLVAHLLARPENNSEFPARWQRFFRREELEATLRQTAGLNVGTILAISSQSLSVGGRHTSLVVQGTAGEAQIERNRIRAAFGLRRANPQGNDIRDPLPSTMFDVNPQHHSIHVIGAGRVVQETQVNGDIYLATPDGPKPLATLDVHLFNGPQNRAVSRIPIGFNFVGRGWGHGVGMSQWGAFEKARRGFTYKQILNFYFQGIIIE
jgi:stage II sporulation protein D